MCVSCPAMKPLAMSLRWSGSSALKKALSSPRNSDWCTCMPLPFSPWSGMHVHHSLFRGDDNAFFSADDPDHLSDMAKGFIAGQLKHMREFTSVVNQYVNSYKRLVPGYEAPVYISWAHRNRTALIRVPLYVQGKESTVRAELRNPDPAANPYLAFAVMLAAGSGLRS